MRRKFEQKLKQRTMKTDLLNINENFKVDWEKIEELEMKMEMEVMENYKKKMNSKQ